MIVRIMSDGQYCVNDTFRSALKEMDSSIVHSMLFGDDKVFTTGLTNMIHAIRSEGQRIDDAELVRSDIIVPPADLTLQEAQAIFVMTGWG